MVRICVWVCVVGKFVVMVRLCGVMRLVVWEVVG